MMARVMSSFFTQFWSPELTFASFEFVYRRHILVVIDLYIANFSLGQIQIWELCVLMFQRLLTLAMRISGLKPVTQLGFLANLPISSYRIEPIFPFLSKI